MRLTRLTITGHALLSDLDFEIRNHLVIVGANDVGKTSILRLLNLLLGASVQQLYQSLTASDIREGADALTVSARLEGIEQDESALFPFAISLHEDEDFLAIQLEARVADDDGESVTIERFFPDSGSRRGPSREQLQTIGWRYLPANRTSGADYMEGRFSPLRSMLQTAAAEEELGDLGGLLEQFNETLAASPALTALRADIAAHLSRAVPRTYTDDSLVLRTKADPREEPLQDVSVFLREGDALKGLAEQSDGMRQLMALTFFDLAQSTANIVAVDEPEIHLHASSQRTVASLFVESPRQRLVVTHSPYIVQRFEPKHVLVVDPDRRVHQLGASSFTEVEKEQAQWWSPQLLEGLTARRVLFVEGLADRIILEAAAKAVDLNLDRLGVTVFALDGADKFKHVLKVVGPKGFGLALAGLCDEDREQSWATTLKLKPATLGEAGFFIAKKDLEHEYCRALGAGAVVEALISGGAVREQGILQSTGASSTDELTDDAVATFLTTSDTRKVPAARAVVPFLTEAVVGASPALSGLLNYLRGTT
ncbi:ATP-dependent endonuclease [Microbacterium sp. RU33B]|uniref:ATP-dependent nuclease n=1 Tax=Microbacterium sp. RU33B TaxID=1907390 RepID=UPI00095A5800|nr:AAA family ATPase [Microbacterium sp. RU33B]SIT72504.1 putative ATP-dependent endonuclease of the OLD family [Microbacterium sp. RU33B]